MSVKFNSSSSYCFDTELSEELITSVKKPHHQTIIFIVILMKFIVGMVIINWRVWFVPGFDFQKLEGIVLGYRL